MAVIVATIVAVLVCREVLSFNLLSVSRETLVVLVQCVYTVKLVNCSTMFMVKLVYP